MSEQERRAFEAGVAYAMSSMREEAQRLRDISLAGQESHVGNIFPQYHAAVEVITRRLETMTLMAIMGGER